MILKRLRSLVKPLIAIALALLIVWFVLVLASYDAGKAFTALWDAGFKDMKAFASVLNRSCPLLFTGLAVAFAMRSNMMNIGAEGQFLAGTIAATWVGISFTGLPGWLLIILMIVTGAIAGAFIGFIPAILKVRMGVSEVITTIMLNYIVQCFVGALIRGPMMDTSQAEPQSYYIAEQAFLPSIIPGTRAHIGFALGVVIAIILYIVLFKTYFGYEVRAVGLNQVAAQTMGIASARTAVYAMIIAGACGGIGGALEIGYNHYLLESISPGYGFTAIAVSILVSNNPIGVIFSSFLFGFISSGSTAMQRTAGVSSTFVQLFMGLIVIFVAVAAESNSTTKRRKVKEAK